MSHSTGVISASCGLGTALGPWFTRKQGAPKTKPASCFVFFCVFFFGFFFSHYVEWWELVGAGMLLATSGMTTQFSAFFMALRRLHLAESLVLGPPCPLGFHTWANMSS